MHKSDDSVIWFRDGDATMGVTVRVIKAARGLILERGVPGATHEMQRQAIAHYELWAREGVL